jgi:uncharacterized damage-inducible protein DinB
MTLEDVRLLYEYNGWANNRVLDACAGLSPEEFTRELGSSFPSVRDTLAHIMGAEWLWLERWSGRMPTELLASKEFPDLASIRQRWAAIGGDVLSFAVRIKAEDLTRVHNIRTTKGEPYSHPLWQMMQHLVNHGTYHRGQVTTMLRQLGAKPVATDLIAFYRQRAGAANG